jgi:peptidoglycan/LPS O-acetylase OafA/YrhL
VRNTHRIQHIDAWRFIAVSLVILSHFFIGSNFLFLVTTYPFLLRLGSFAELGVLIFFFISGFVICRGLIDEHAASSWISLKAFYLRRAFRILPPLYLYLLVLALLSAFALIDISHTKIATSALFLCNLSYGGGGCGWFAGHTWSLAYEEQFYLFYPLLFITLGLAARPIVLLIIILQMVLTALGLRFAGADWSAGYLHYMIFMLTGCVGALYWGWLSPWCRRLSSRYWWGALTLLVLCVGLLPNPLEAYVKTVLYPPLIGFLVLGTPVARPRLREFFQNPLISNLGKISYTVYLWQQLATAQYPALSPWWTVLFVLGVWLFAHGSYRYFERPLIGVAARWSDSIKRRDAAVRGVRVNP